MITAHPLVSFVIPSYNQGRFIRNTLDSIAIQNLPRETFEVLVFDGGSTDETIDILQTHSLQPKWVSQKDKGQSDAINQGLMIAKGDIIAWINSDDIYLHGALTHIIDTFTKNPNIDVIYGKAMLIDQHGATVGAYPVENWNFNRLSETCFLCQPAVFFRKKVITQYGLLDEKLHYAMDYDFWLRIGKRKPFQFIDLCLAGSRIHSETKSLRDKPGVFREGMEVSRKHTGAWNRNWVRGYGYWRAMQWCSRNGIKSAILTGIAIMISRTTLCAMCKIRG